MNLLTQMVSEVTTPEEFFQACHMVHHHVITGRDVDITAMHALAVKGHLVSMNYPESAPAVSIMFLNVHRASPRPPE